MVDPVAVDSATPSVFISVLKCFDNPFEFELGAMTRIGQSNNTSSKRHELMKNVEKMKIIDIDFRLSTFETFASANNDKPWRSGERLHGNPRPRAGQPTLAQYQYRLGRSVMKIKNSELCCDCEATCIST